MAWLRRLHAWLGLVLSLLLAAMALSGAALVFKDDWRRGTLSQPPLTERGPLELAKAIETAHAAFAPGEVTAVLFASPHLRLDEVFLRNGAGAYLDPRSAAVTARWEAEARPADILFDLHHRLFAGELGIRITGWIGVLAAGMALSGLVLWWPARRSFRFRWKPAGPTRAGWLAAHRDLGALVAPMALWVTLSGACLALDDLSAPLFGFAPPKPPAADETGPVDWAAVLTSAQARFPDAAPRYAIPPQKAGAPVQIRLQQPGEWHANGRTQVWLEPDGRVLAVHDVMHAGRGERAYYALWPLHAVKVGGLAWKAVVFLAGLGVAALALYGAEAYRRKLLGKPARARRAPPDAAAGGATRRRRSA